MKTNEAYTKHIIWTNEIDYDDWKEDLEANYPDEEGYDEEDRIRIMYEDNDSYLDDEKANLNNELGKSIVLIARLGLWNGTRNAHKVLKGTNLNTIFEGTCGDYVTWYVEDGDIKCDDIHHDGTNHYTYRTIKDGIGDWEFEEMVAEGKDIFELTDKLGHYVSETYGWEE